MPHAAIDFESYYDDEYGLKKMTGWAYVWDARFDAYWVALDGDVKYSGHPKDFDWNSVDGFVLWAHNMAFDGLVWRRLQHDGVIPVHVKVEFRCTADLAAYMQRPRNLLGASKCLLPDVPMISKAFRGDMKGKKAAAIDKKGLTEYGAGDARNCFLLAERYGPQWPAEEIELSQLNCESQFNGMPVNVSRLDDAITQVAKLQFKTLASMPWVEAGEKPLSVKAIREHGRKCGIPVPASLDKSTPEMVAWGEQYGEEFEWVRSIVSLREINTLLSRLQKLRGSVDSAGCAHMPVRYYGAQRTGRFAAGDDKDDERRSGHSFNAQNQYRKEVHGVDLRDLFEAPPGFVFGIFDYDQIEARVLQWRVGNTRMLDLIRQEGNVYQAYAKSAGLYSGANLNKDDPNLYQLAKVSVLLLGYQGGAKKFRDMSAKKYGVHMTAEQAEDSKCRWREANPETVQFWYDHQKYLRLSASAEDRLHEVEIASGRVLRYWRPKWNKSIDKEGEVHWDIYTSAYETGPGRKTYGGLITENEIQATARDVLRDGWIQVCREFGRDVVRLSVHDELVTLLPEDKAEGMAPRIAECMTAATQTWAKGCPISVSELKLAKTYTKKV